jgi:hypothetical protein
MEPDGIGDAERSVNRHLREREIEPISVSMSFKDGYIFLAVVVKESEGTEENNDDCK